MLRLGPICVLIAVLWLSSAPAFADTVFTDGTFNPANYSTVGPFSSNPSITLTADQCASCGHPGNALQLIGTFANGTAGHVDAGFVNNTFSYDPLTQGAINSISASVDKDLSTSYANNSSNPTLNTFRPMILQDGVYYLAAIIGPSIMSGTTTGYNTLSNSDLAATDFLEYNFATGTFGIGNPNFDGDPMLFGLAQVFTSGGSTQTITIEADYDNLHLDISTPEPSSLLLLACGMLGLVAISRRKASLDVIG
jgi:hypothetical protein